MTCVTSLEKEEPVVREDEPKCCEQAHLWYGPIYSIPCGDTIMIKKMCLNCGAGFFTHIKHHDDTTDETVWYEDGSPGAVEYVNTIKNRWSFLDAKTK